MTYRANKKAKKLWSLQANAAKDRKRLLNENQRPEPVEIDPYIKITIERSHTKEIAVFECLEGSRIDNYSIYCNDKPLGIHGITFLMNSIRKSLPRFRRINE
jgi:hypothetical protein